MSDPFALGGNGLPIAPHNTPASIGAIPSPLTDTTHGARGATDGAGGLAHPLATATAPGLVPALAAGQSPQGAPGGAGVVVAYTRCPAAITWAQLIAAPMTPGPAFAGTVLALTTFVGEDGATQARGVDWTGDIFVECLLDAAGTWVWRPIGHSHVTTLDWYRPAAHAWLAGLKCTASDTPNVSYYLSGGTAWVLDGSPEGWDQAGYRDWSSTAWLQGTPFANVALINTANTSGVIIFRTDVAGGGNSRLLDRSNAGVGRGGVIGINAIGGADCIDMGLAGTAGTWQTLYAAGTVTTVQRYCLAWANLGGNPAHVHCSLSGGAVVDKAFGAGALADCNTGDNFALGAAAGGGFAATGWTIMAVSLFSTLISDANLVLMSGDYTAGQTVRTRGVIPSGGETVTYKWNGRWYRQADAQHSYNENLHLIVQRGTSSGSGGPRKVVVP